MDNKSQFQHQSVMLNEVLSTFSYLPRFNNPVFVDGTIGLAGHCREISRQISSNKKSSFAKATDDKQDTNKSQIPNIKIIGIDKDEEALKIAKEKLSNANNIKLHLINDAFENIKSILSDLKINAVDGILLDLGVSSMQLDDSERGFSFQKDAPLDMRMNQSNQLTAGVIINSWNERDLLRLFFEYGEEKYSRRIVGNILKARSAKSIQTTKELVNIIQESVPNYRGSKTHPATNVFRALRMAVNAEVSSLAQGMIDCVDVLNVGGRLAVITFHSIEDRIVKQTLQKLLKPCTCPPQQPICVCGQKTTIKLVNRKALIPSKEEILANPRARSAKLRVVEKIS